MKSAKPAVADASSNRRSQPVRNTRVNPPRSSIHAGRPGAVIQPPLSRPAGNQPIDIFPAITHFADSITALPKELVRHFTLLKEVDAKIFTPQDQLFKLVSAATNSSLPDSRLNNDASSTIAPTSAPMSTQGSSTGYAGDQSIQPPSVADLTTSSSTVFDPSNIPRRQLFRQTAFKIQELLTSLEEKNHVISTANEALQRQLARIEDVWPHLENEFSDEAKWGSTTHWAYPENRHGQSHPEKLRRDGAAAISAAARALADEAAARSDARKQAVQAKRNMKNGHQDSDMDDIDSRATKKPQKGRRGADADSVGLGISSSANPQKRRKTEKAVNGGTAMERSVSAATSKAKMGSPRGTPGPEPKKRKALPNASGQSRKKNGLHAKTPSVTSSPVLGVYPEPKGRASPVPTSAPRPASSRARQNSIQSNNDITKTKVTAAVSNKVNGNSNGNGNGTTTPDEAQSVNGISNDIKAKDSSASIKTENAKKENDKPEFSASKPAGRRESRTEEMDKQDTAELASVPMVTTKSGRASKPSTPALATFQEAALSRASRNRDGAGTRKTQKKTTAAVQALAQVATDDDATSSMQGDDDDGDIDADEPRYCYCNGVSYGEMVACDSDDCEREWFHLACVGLRVAPGSKTKWYCEDCQKRLKLGKKSGGR